MLAVIRCATGTRLLLFFPAILIYALFIPCEYLRRLNLILIGVAIPMLLTATVFAAPGRGGIFGTEVKTATNLQSDQTSINSGGLIAAAEATTGVNHEIALVAEPLDNGLLAYRMGSHEVYNGTTLVDDRTADYSEEPSIPGPTIVITEGDTVDLTIVNNLGEDNVSVHVHGVHYEIDSDGTLQHINGIGDQGATPFANYTVHWIAGLGTAGTWPYHDHNFGGLNGAEHKGLFGTLIVNPADGVLRAVDNKDIKEINLDNVTKEFVLYIGDDAFWGMEIASDGTQTPLWVNPTLGAKNGDYVRFHLIALGTDVVHQFRLGSYKWLDPGTDNLINSVDIGPLENHQFTLKVKNGNASYMDNNESNKLMGMQGKLKVTNNGAPSASSGEPDAF